jgi:uncharacterized protein YbjT (DUF2867 family)
VNVVVIGATGTVGAPVVRTLVEHGASVRAYVRDEQKARRQLAPPADAPGSLDIVPGQLDDAAGVQAALSSADVGFIAMGPTGAQGELQRQVIEAASRAELPHLVRLSVLSTDHQSLGLNQRAHAELDDAVAKGGLAYTSLRPALFATSVLAAAPQIRKTGGWIGGAAHGRNALIDPRDVAASAAAVLLDPGAWGHHYELTGPAPYSWPDVADLLSRELGTTVDFGATDDDSLRSTLLSEGVPPPAADVFIAREHATEAGENDRLSANVQLLTGSPPRQLSAYLHEHRAEFLPAP